MEIEAKAILQTLEENSSELAVSLLGERSAGDQHIETVVAGESVRPLTVLGAAKEKMGDVESAVVLFKSALEYLDVAEASGYYVVRHAQREFIGGRLQHIKHKMGLISPSEEVAELRENLDRLIQKKDNEMRIALAKQQLAVALKKMDPPQYFEAIKLMKESSAVCAQVLGDQHEVSAMTKHLCDKTRKEYMLYLQDIARNGNEQT